MLEDAVGEPAESTELVYLVKLKSPKVIRQELPAVTPTQIDRFKALTETYAEGVSRQDWYPSPGMHCRWCGFRSRCSAWAGNKPAAARAA